MKKFFVLFMMLASTQVFATLIPSKYCTWNFAPTSAWTCATGTPGTLSLPTKYVTGVRCLLASQCSSVVLLDDCLSSGVNCGKFHRASTFDFNIKAGGAHLNLYVCEAGFANRHCKNCGTNIIRFFKDGGTTQVTPDHQSTDGEALAAFVERFWTFRADQGVTSASLYLNSLNTDAGFYVKWCLDVKRMIVGHSFADILANAPVFQTIDTITFNPGGANNAYFDVAGLKAYVFKKCGPHSLVRGLPDAFDAFIPQAGAFVLDNFNAAEQQTIDLGGDLNLLGLLEDLNVGPDAVCLGGHCTWTVLYKEMNNCVIRDVNFGADTFDSNHCPVEGCVPRQAQLSTTLNLDVDFCPDGHCI